MTITDQQSIEGLELEERQALGEELEGLEGLIYRIGTAFDPHGMHSAALSVVCEAIYLARQVMTQDRVGRNDVDDLHAAISDLEKKGVEWKTAALHKQLWPALPEHLRPESGPTRTALEYALHEWLTQAETEGKSVAQLAEEFTAFCETTPKLSKPARKRAKS